MYEIISEIGRKLPETIIITLVTALVTSIIKKLKQKIDKPLPVNKVKYKGILKIRYYKFTMYLCSVLSCAFYIILSFALYKVSLKIYLGNIINLNNTLIDFIFIGSILFATLVFCAVILIELINNFLSKFGLKKDKNSIFIFFILVSMIHFALNIMIFYHQNLLPYL